MSKALFLGSTDFRENRFSFGPIVTVPNTPVASGQGTRSSFGVQNLLGSGGSKILVPLQQGLAERRLVSGRFHTRKSHFALQREGRSGWDPPHRLNPTAAQVTPWGFFILQRLLPSWFP